MPRLSGPISPRRSATTSAEVRRSASRAILKLGPQGAVFIPDIILMAEKKENVPIGGPVAPPVRTGGAGRAIAPGTRRSSQVISRSAVRLLAIKFLGLAGRNAGEAIPALEKMRDDPSPEIRKQAQAACERIPSRDHRRRDRSRS